MQDKSDVQLLRAYAESGHEAAFREIVTRHTDLVYSAALRQVAAADLACDLAQGVFSDLARKAHPLAAKLVEGSSLVGWLYCSTRFAALKHLRDDRRRLAHERQAMEQLITNAESTSDWEHVRPVLDEAMAELNDTDREALLLRFFKNGDFHTVGQALGVSDAAAQKRVSRAVDRLREFFAKRGVTVGAGGLAVVISTNAVQAAPVGLALTISTAAVLTGTTLATTATVTATKAIAMTALQKTIVTATIAVLAGAGIYEARQASQLRDQVQTLQQQQAPLAEQIQQLQRERDDATNRVAGLYDEIARLNHNSAELLKLRGETPRLRTDSKELARIKAAQVQTWKSKTEAQNNFVNFALAQAKDSLTNAALGKLEGMKKDLDLTPDQERNLKAVLLNSVAAEAQAMTARLTGGQSSEEDDRNQAIHLHAEKESRIAALLTPEQQLAYEEMKKAEVANRAADFAMRESSAMKTSLHLSPEQTAAVTSILASLPAGQGGSGDATDPNAKAQLETRLQALASALTPEQLQIYRQKKLTELEQAALAMQMLKAIGGK